MRFVVRMAWREMRASWARLLFFFVCVALGVAAIVALRSVVQNVRTTLTREARTLVGADVVVQSPRPWADGVRDRLDRVLTHAGAEARLDVVDTQTMAARPDASVVRLVEVRGVEAGYPFYGAPELEDGLAFSHALLADHGVLIPPSLRAELAVNVGETLLLAGRPYTVRGIVARDRVQRSGGFAFGPRVYVDLADLRASSVLTFGSRATYQVLVRVDDTRLTRLAQLVRRSFGRGLVTVRSWRSVEDRLGRNLTLAEDYLSLVGFAMVVLGGIGVWSVTRVFVEQKIRSIAILKCVGATSGRVLATYLLQVSWLALGGSVAGVGLAAAAMTAVPSSLLEPLGVAAIGLTASAAAQGVAVGVLVSGLFALVPLLEVRRVKPLLLLRADTAPSARARDWQSWLAGAAMVALVALVAVWQANSLRAGLYVSGGLAVVGLVLLAASRLVVRAVAPLARSPRFALRHAVISLGRPGNQTRVILMAVGLGCFFVLTVRALQANLVAEFDVEAGRGAPDLILIDVQPDQVEGVRETVTPFAAAPPRLLPLMRARVTGVEGRRLQLPTAADVRRHGELTREYGVTFRDALAGNETVETGRFWTGPIARSELAEGVDTEVSIEVRVRDQADLEIGDLIRFDVGGREIAARVTSVRRVMWDEVQEGGFYFVLRPSPAVGQAAHTFVAFLAVGDAPETRAGLQRALVAGYPNVSVIDVRDIVASIRTVVDNATLGVSIVGGVMLVSGVLILVGAVAMTKFQRLYEAAIYRTLGASTRLLASMVAVEYALLGLLAGVLGAAGALGLSWAAARGLFDIAWRPAPGLLAAGVALAAVLVGVVGLAASLDVLVRKPLATLRSE